MTIDTGKQVIVPNARFDCNGRITSVAASMNGGLLGPRNYPIFQVWHLNQTSNIHKKINEVKLSAGRYIVVGGQEEGYYLTNITLNSNSQIEFQSGDVIGYYQPSNARQIWSIHTNEYTSYSYYTSTTPATLLSLESGGISATNYQPLIEVMYGKVIIVWMAVIV